MFLFAQSLNTLVILLEPQGGLANRMRVIASGIALKEKINARLTIIWNENYELRCPYEMLFEDGPHFTLIKKQKKHNYIRSLSGLPTAKKTAYFLYHKLLGIGKVIQEADFPNLIWSGKLDIAETAKKYDTIYIQTCQEFGNPCQVYRYFKPVPALMQKISETSRTFNNYTFGVQIRRTDNEKSIQHSPVALFIEKMQTLLEREERTTFFLCTDDREVEEQLRFVFGSRIITNKAELSRQTVVGIQDALLDLFCLSKTTHILGSFYSSFAEVAAKLEGAELEVVRNAINLSN